MITSNPGPIRAIQDWHRSATSSSSCDLKYHEAVETMMDDFTMMQKLDDISPADSHLTDHDRRPGEVDVPEVGSLKSTQEGFNLTVIGHPYSTPRNIRSHAINVATGTITVVQEVCPQNSDRGYVERYTIDTQNHTIEDYSQRIKMWHHPHRRD